MNRNPVIPFILILLLGVGLIFFMSAHGANKEEEKEGGGGAKTEKFDAATFARTIVQVVMDKILKVEWDLN